MTSETPVVIVSSVSRPQERRWAGSLGRLADAMRTIGVDEPVLIGVGAVFSRRAEATVLNHESLSQEQRFGPI